MYDLNPHGGEVNDLMLQEAKLVSPIQALVLPVKSNFISVFERCIVVTSKYIYKQAGWRPQFLASLEKSVLVLILCHMPVTKRSAGTSSSNRSVNVLKK